MENVEKFFDKMALNWDSDESHTREEKIALLDELDLKKGNKVMDIACGTGVITGLIHEYTSSDVLGVDISSNMIDIARSKYKDYSWATFIKADILEYRPDIKFDCAIIYNDYPHFPEPKKLSKSLKNILNENGKFAILHSLSREELDKHHSARALNVSRSLEAPLIEANNFKDEFKILKAFETNHSFVIVGTVKNN